MKDDERPTSVGDKMICPGCGDPLTLTPMDGWAGPHVGCVGRTAHSDWIIKTLGTTILELTSR